MGEGKGMEHRFFFQGWIWRRRCSGQSARGREAGPPPPCSQPLSAGSPPARLDPAVCSLRHILPRTAKTPPSNGPQGSPGPPVKGPQSCRDTRFVYLLPWLQNESRCSSDACQGSAAAPSPCSAPAPRHRRPPAAEPHLPRVERAGDADRDALGLVGRKQRAHRKRPDRQGVHRGLQARRRLRVGQLVSAAGKAACRKVTKPVSFAAVSGGGTAAAPPCAKSHARVSALSAVWMVAGGQRDHTSCCLLAT